MNAPKIIRQLTEAAFDKKDMERRMANLRARRGEDDPVMAALDRGELPPENWNEPTPVPAPF